jgi:hypothetical protein
MKQMKTSMAIIIAVHFARIAMASHHNVIENVTVKQSPMDLIPAMNTTAQYMVGAVVGTNLAD